MSDAPEQIWIDATNSWATVSHKHKPNRTEYTRSDLVPQWQSMDSAPKDGTEILGAWKYGGWNFHPMIWKLGGWRDRFNVNTTHTPTAWMPLLQPPEGE